MTGTTESPQFELVLSVPKGEGMTDTARANRQLILDYYIARKKGDPDAFGRLVDKDVAFFQASSLPYGGEASGVEAAQALIRSMYATWRDLRVEVLELTAGGDLVIAYLMLTLVSRATGGRYHGPTAEVFRIRDGKVVQWRPIYWDTHQVRQVCGVV